MGSKLKINPQSKIQQVSVVENEKTYLQWRRRWHGGENVRGQYSVSHTTETKNNTANWGRKRKIFGSKLLNQSTNQNPTTFSGGKQRNSPTMVALAVAGTEEKNAQRNRGRRGVRASFRKQINVCVVLGQRNLTSGICWADVI